MSSPQCSRNQNRLSGVVVSRPTGSDGRRPPRVPATVPATVPAAPRPVAVRPRPLSPAEALALVRGGPLDAPFIWATLNFERTMLSAPDPKCSGDVYLGDLW